MIRPVFLVWSVLSLLFIGGCGDPSPKPSVASPPAVETKPLTPSTAQQPVQADASPKTAPAAPAPKEESPPDMTKLELWPVMCHFEEPIATGFIDAAKLGIDDAGLRQLGGLLHHMETNRADAVVGAERMRYIVLAYAADHINKGLKDVYKPILEAQDKGNSQEFSRLANAVNAWRLWNGTWQHAFGQGVDPNLTDEVKSMQELREKVRTAKDVASQKDLIAEMQKQHSAYAKKIGLVKDATPTPSPALQVATTPKTVPKTPHIKVVAGSPKAMATELHGTWIVVSLVSYGKPNEKEIGRKWEIDTEKLHIGGIPTAGPGLGFSYVADPTATPKQIDILPKVIDLSATSQTVLFQGIYKVDGDRLTICWGRGDRKTDFQTEDKGTYYVLERAK